MAAEKFVIYYVTAHGPEIPSIETTSLAFTQALLPELTAEGYIFDGWYYSSEFNENQKVRYGDQIVGNITLYAKWVSTNTVGFKMTALADEIRELSGTTGTMGLDAMAGRVGEANDEVDGQAELIAQIANALEGKANTNGMTEVDTCTIRIWNESTTNYFVGYTQYLDGTFIAASSQLESQVFTTLTNVVCNSSICIITSPSYEPTSNEAQIGSYTLNNNATLRVFRAAGNKDEDTTIIFYYIYA